MALESLPQIIHGIRKELLDALGKASSFKLLKEDEDDASIREQLIACKETGLLLEAKIRSIISQLKSVEYCTGNDIKKLKELLSE